MKKTIIVRAIMGIPIGITISYIITICISLGWAEGYYTSCVPQLAEELGSEINAVILQAALSALLGAVFGAASVIWETENWSLLKQSAVYFLIISLAMFPVAYFTYWMEHTIAGAFTYFCIFFLIAAAVWLIQFCFWKSRVKKISDKVIKQSK